MFKEFVGLTLLLALAPSTEPFDDSTPRPLPISAHNCYAENRIDNPRLTEALRSGLTTSRSTSGGTTRRNSSSSATTQSPGPAVAYPRLETSLIPALESHFKVPRPDGAPTMLTIDWKTGRPEAVKQFKESARRARRMVLVGTQGGRLSVDDPAADRLLQWQRGRERCL